MNNWKNYLFKELGNIIAALADGLISDPNVMADKLRQIAFRIATNKKQE